MLFVNNEWSPALVTVTPLQYRCPFIACWRKEGEGWLYRTKTETDLSDIHSNRLGMHDSNTSAGTSSTHAKVREESKWKTQSKRLTLTVYLALGCRFSFLHTTTVSRSKTNYWTGTSTTRSSDGIDLLYSVHCPFAANLRTVLLNDYALCSPTFVLVLLWRTTLKYYCVQYARYTVRYIRRV